MPIVAEHLVGRAAELGAADDLLRSVAGGGTATLLLAGEPGIGKTRLLAELAAHADAQGCLVLTGSASELESDLPYWVFVDALDEFVAGLDPRRVAALGDDVAGELGQVLPAASGFARGGPGGADQRYRAHGAVRALLERLAASRPLALMLDDLHWADPASVELLAALLRRPPSASVLLALATRPRQVDDRLARAFERGQRHGELTRVDLGGLGRAEAGQLLGDGVDAARADVLFAESGGNPFYLEQLARTTGATVPGSPALVLGGVEVPPAVAASLAEELALLAAPTRRVLEGAAVAGDPFEPELAAAAAGLQEPDAMAPLDELAALGLVRPTDVPRRFRFRHPLVRRAVYESAPAAWRLSAHERCAEALAARGAPPAARAHHVEHAGRHGDAGAAALLTEAAEAVFGRAPASAAAWWAAALRLLPEAAPREQRAYLHMNLARAFMSIARIRDSHRELVTAIELVPPEAVAWWVELTVACAALEQLIGVHETARGRLADALHRLPDPASAEAVGLMMELAISDLFRTRFASMHDWAARAHAAARPLGDRPLAAAAAATLALAATFAGALDEADAARAEAAALIATLSDEELARRSAAAAYLAAAELYLDRYDDAAAYVERAYAVQRATGHQSMVIVGTTLALAWTMQGRLADARQLLDAAIERIRTQGIRQGRAFHLMHRALVAIAAGDTDGALADAEEAFALTRELDETFVSGWAALALAAAVEAAGDPARAEQVLEERQPELQAGWGVAALELLTRCRVARGEVERAREPAEQAAAAAAAMPVPMAVAWAARAEAAVRLADGDAAGAAERALAAASAADGASAPVEAAIGRVLAARALVEAGDVDAAVTELETAAAAFERCGAVRRREAAEQELRRLGRRVHRRGRPGAADAGGLESLTGRELEVVDLVVDRRTNPEIAAQLFLSLKTVETHLRNVFRKLGVSSRVELAREVERLRRS
jgi:ATP/maltotriose-dependent transcriptional regulator MalT